MSDSRLVAPEEQRPIVVVSVGTDHHKFDRLIDWTENFASSNPEVLVVVQRGTSRTPDNLLSKGLIPHEEICELFGRATAVVSHGGPSTVMDARAQGRLPIVVPRDSELGEHVDRHQMRFAEHLTENGFARVANTEKELVTLLETALSNPAVFTIEIAKSYVPEGVVKFGQVLDDLLGVSTPVVLRESRVAGNDAQQKPKGSAS